MACKIAIFNMKGGVGKSTTAYNLAAGLVQSHNQRVLLIDTDPQGHSGAALGLPIWEIQAQLKDVFQGQISIHQAITSTSSGVDVVPSNIQLAEEEIPISGRPGRERLLQKAIKSVTDQYDFILIDCPPNIGVFSVNALMACDGVLIPVDMSYLGLMSIQGIERALKLIREELEHPIQIVGVLATRFDKRNKLSKEAFESLHEHFGDQLLQTVIPETVRLREAPSFGQSIFEYDPKGNGSRAYKVILDEVMVWQSRNQNVQH
ncbi:ParA family protein (plasmid) [Acaryochloris sp. 'Moss Beach']|nr:ParA family protein [Acaryochloris sp. 'Moss Beach']